MFILKQNPVEIDAVERRGGRSHDPPIAGNTGAENLLKFGRTISEICSRRDRQTDALIAIFRTRAGKGWSNDDNQHEGSAN